jgi:hypothetical protein
MAKKKIIHDYPFVGIEWADHWATGTNDPYTLEKLTELAKEPIIRETGGYLVHENKRVIVLCGTIEEDGTLTECNFLMKRLIINRSDKK